MSKEKSSVPFYKKKWFLILVAVIVIAALASGNNDKDEPKKDDSTAVVENANEGSTTQEQPTVADTTEKPSPEPEPEPTMTKIGEEIQVGDVVYKVNSVTTAKTIGSEYVSTEAQGIFLILDLSITNKGNDSLSVSSSFFVLLNGEKKYEADDSASFYLSTENGGESVLYEEINPDLTLTGRIAFDVSEEVANSNDTQLQVQTGLFGTQKGLISLER